MLHLDIERAKNKKVLPHRKSRLIRELIVTLVAGVVLLPLLLPLTVVAAAANKGDCMVVGAKKTT